MNTILKPVVHASPESEKWNINIFSAPANRLERFSLSRGKVILLVHIYPCQTFASIPIRAYHKDLNG
jgi:hypothetical protein